MYEVFDNLHMLRMSIWMCPYHVRMALVGQASESSLEFVVPAR